MKIRLLSDLHLEMPYNKEPISQRPFHYENLGEDVVVLAGDINTQAKHIQLIQRILAGGAKILMVAGNHEAYGASFEGVHDFFYNLQAEYPKFYYLNNDNMVIDNIDFFGGIMYTNLEGQDIDKLCTRYIPDFSVIYKEPRLELMSVTEDFVNFTPKWTPQDHRDAHQEFCKEFGYWKISSNATKKVVITHFVPTYKALAPQFAKSALNPYFIQDMEHTMTGIDLWMFGHTHTSFDFMIDETRLVSNPYGYGEENKDGFVIDKIIEI